MNYCGGHAFVFFRCVPNSQNPHGVSLFLSEPASCEYVLVVSSHYFSVLCTIYFMYLNDMETNLFYTRKIFPSIVCACVLGGEGVEGSFVKIVTKSIIYCFFFSLSLYIYGIWLVYHSKIKRQ